MVAAALCLISFSVMAADKDRGWTTDAFNSYKEYRWVVLPGSGCQDLMIPILRRSSYRCFGLCMVQVLPFRECDRVRVRGVPGIRGSPPHEQQETYHPPSYGELL